MRAPMFIIFLVYRCTDLHFFSIRTFAIVIILDNWPFLCTCTCIRAVTTAALFRAVIIAPGMQYTHTDEYLMSRPERGVGARAPGAPLLDPPMIYKQRIVFPMGKSVGDALQLDNDGEDQQDVSDPPPHSTCIRIIV